MAEPKDTSPEKQAGGAAIKWILITVALVWLVTNKSTIKAFWEEHKPRKAYDHFEMVELKVGKVSREVFTDPTKEMLDFDIVNTNQSWYVIRNGDIGSKTLMKPGEPTKILGRGVYKLQFELEENETEDGQVSVHYTPH